MKTMEERAIRCTPAGMEVLHAEITLEADDGRLFYVQAHDNGNGRYYALCSQSWFALQQSGEEEEDPLEEYFTNDGDGESPQEEPDFLTLLRPRDRREAPYEDSAYVDSFVRADRLLDDLAEE